jgi:hypothetical protein
MRTTTAVSDAAPSGLATWRAAMRPQRILPYAVAVLLAIGFRLPTLNNGIVFIDEPAYLAEAARLDTPLKFMFSALYVSET